MANPSQPRVYRRARLLTTLVAAALIALVHVAAAAARQPQAHHAHGHLYVTSFYGGTTGILRFPLDADGLPARQPDGMLSGLSEPLSVGFDGEGFMYVADSPQVKVYAPGATGNAHPVRVINLAGPEFLAVDAAGFVYVTSGYTTIDVFAPGVGPSSAPINTIPINNDIILDMSPDSAGELFAADDCNKIYLFKRPTYEQTPDITFPGGCWATPIAVDLDQSLLYFRQSGFGKPLSASEYRALNLDFTPVKKHTNDMTYNATDCWSGGSNGTPEDGLAVNKNYYMFSCDLPSGGVFVYRNVPGRQKMIEKLAPSGMGAPAGIHLGP